MYELREYNIGDKEQVIKLWLDICIEEHNFLEWEDELKILENDSYDKIIVAIYNNIIIGTIAYKDVDKETAELKRLYLYKEYRGKGIAKDMLNAIIEILRLKNYKKMLVETWEKFESGRKFYEKNNFVLQNINGEVYNYILEL